MTPIMKAKINLILIFIFTAGLLYGQGSAGTVNARSAGLGRIVTASDGLFSVGGNPANIFRKDSPTKFELIVPIPLPAVSAQVGTNFFTLNDYNYFFGGNSIDENGNTVGRYLTEEDKNRFKDLFSDGGTITTDAKINWFAFAITPNPTFGTVAFSISDIISSRATFPQDLISLGLDGNLQNRVYNFNDTKFQAMWLRKYSFSYAREFNILPMFQDFTIGASLNIVNGFAYAGVEKVESKIWTDENNVITGTGDFLAYSSFSNDFGVKYDFDSLAAKRDAAFSIFPEPAGAGIGFDFGVNAQINDAWSISFAVTDIGSVKWTQNVAEFKSQQAIFLDDLTNKDQRDSLVDGLTGKGSGNYINEITTDMPTALHIGINFQVDKLSRRLKNKLLFAFEFTQGFNNQLRNTTKPRFSLGIDWVPSFLAFRTGFSFGGINKFGWAAGLGLNFGILELNFGTPDMQYVFSSNSAKRINVALDSRWKF